MSVQLLHGRRKGVEPARVYLASSVSTFALPTYETTCAAVAAHFPGAVLVPARDCYADSAEWRARWPREAASYAALVFFADLDGCIGRGVYREIADMRALRRPVYFFTTCGELHPLPWVRLVLSNCGTDSRQYVRVELAPCAGTGALGADGIPPAFFNEASALGRRGHAQTRRLVRREALLRRLAERRREHGRRG